MIGSYMRAKSTVLSPADSKKGGVYAVSLVKRAFSLGRWLRKLRLRMDSLIATALYNFIVGVGRLTGVALSPLVTTSSTFSDRPFLRAGYMGITSCVVAVASHALVASLSTECVRLHP